MSSFQALREFISNIHYTQHWSKEDFNQTRYCKISVFVIKLLVWNKHVDYNGTYDAMSTREQ